MLEALLILIIFCYERHLLASITNIFTFLLYIILTKYWYWLDTEDSKLKLIFVILVSFSNLASTRTLVWSSLSRSDCRFPMHSKLIKRYLRCCWIDCFSRIFRATMSNYRHEIDKIDVYRNFHFFTCWKLQPIPAGNSSRGNTGALSLRNVASKFYFQVSRRRDAAFPVFPAPASMCVTLDILSSTQNTGRLFPWPILFPSLFALPLTFYLMSPFNPRNLRTSDLIFPTDF